MKWKHGQTAEIAGAGFSGLSSAIALAQLGWKVTVHEKSPILREQGAGIVLFHNSLSALNKMGVYRYIESRSMTPIFYETKMHNKSVSKEDFDGIWWRTTTRPALHEALVKRAIECGVIIQTASEVISVNNEILTLRSGEKRNADLIVGADGVKSNVRDSMAFKLDRWTSRDGITRFLVPRCKEQLGTGEWDNVIDYWNLEPRYLRILYVPCNDNELYIALGAPQADEQGSRTPIDLELWVKTFPFLKPVLEYANEAPDPKYYGYSTTKLENWTSGNVVLVGDAAHAMCPALAQGAGCAIMNAYTMATAVTYADSHTLPTALTNWETQVRPITDRVQKRSADYASNRGMANGHQFSGDVLETARYNPISKL